jgi:hypothetical protein
MNHSKLPFITEGFRIPLGRKDFLGCLRGGSGEALSSPEADESKSNKFSACIEAWVTPLLPAEVEDFFLPAISTLATEAFSTRLSLEDFTTNLLLRFRGLARASSHAEVYVSE